MDYYVKRKLKIGPLYTGERRDGSIFFPYTRDIKKMEFYVTVDQKPLRIEVNLEK